MTSDVLMIFKRALSDVEDRAVRAVLMDAGRSVLVHQKDGHARLFLIKFDPAELAPDALLDAVRATGLEVSIAGG